MTTGKERQVTIGIKILVLCEEEGRQFKCQFFATSFQLPLSIHHLKTSNKGFDFFFFSEVRGGAQKKAQLTNEDVS